MKKKLFYGAAVLMLLAGIGIYLYPTAGDALNHIRSATAIAQYQKASDVKDGAALAAMIAEAEAYNRSLPKTLSMDPFGTAQTDPYRNDGEYNRMLSLDGIMGYIDIPVIDVFLPVCHGMGEETLKKGAGHLYGSSLPVGGRGTHSVILAHRGLPSAKLFTDLDQVHVGDIFYYHVLDRILAYQVDQIKVVEPTRLDDLSVDPDADYMTLLTCTPYGINTQRMLVRGARIPYEVKNGLDEATGAQPPRQDVSLPAWVKLFVGGAAAAVGLLLAGFALTVMRGRKTNKGRRKKTVNEPSGAQQSERSAENEKREEFYE